MSSVAFPRGATVGRPGRSLPAVLSTAGVDILLAVVLIALAVALLAFLPAAFSVDSWLALVSGREVWQHGLPQYEVLTAMAHGTRWIDQQWLSQLAVFGVYRLAGLGLVGVVNTALFVGGAAGAIIAARKLGAPAGAVLLTLPLCLGLVVYSHEVRTQEFAMPLFALIAYLLASDSRHPSRRVYWCLPLLILWANLHGSVTLGAFLVGLRGVTLAWERRPLLRSPREWRRPLALALGAPLCLLATPYGLSILSYYRTMFLGNAVMKAVSEWQPVTTVPILAVPFFAAAALGAWSIGRSPGRTTRWEQLTLLALTAVSIEVIRNLLFFGLFALMILPVALGGRAGTERSAQPASGGRGRGAVNAVLVAAALVALLVTGVVRLTQPASAIELSYQRTRILTIVQQVTRADPSLKLLTDVRFGDWLLWRDPELAGRIANDARWELLTPAQMAALQAVFSVTGTNWKRGARGYRLLVLDQEDEPEAAQAFTAEPGSRVLYDDGERLVILRSAGEAG